MDDWSRALSLLRRHKIKWVDTAVLDGLAQDGVFRQIYAARPVDARTFAIFCHEVGHILGSGEVESWNFALSQAREFGLPVGEVKRAIRVYLFQNAPLLLPHFQ
jgi:hypothetical protein